MASKQSRLYFMDNLRYLCVWCVVVYHTSVGYIGLPEFYVETETTRALLPIRHAVLIFTLPMLFLLAGYFTLPSLRKRTSWTFLKQKLVRLGLPFLIGIVFLGPLMPYLGYYAQSFKGLPTASYWDFWLHYIASGFSQLTRSVVFTTHPVFHHQHFYFLAFLLEILVGFLLIRWVWTRWRSGRDQEATVRTRPRFAGAFLLVAIGVPVLHYLASRLPGSAEVIAFFFYFSLSDLILFGGAFALGVYAYSRRWYQDGNIPDWRLLAVLGITFLLFHQGTSFLHAHRDEVAPGLLLLEQGLAGSLAMWLTIAVLLLVGFKIINRPSRFNAEMAASSYDVYMLQYPVILGLRFPLITWEVSAWIKFALVVPLTIVICWAISRFLIRPRPKTTLGVIVLLHVLLCTFGVPRWGDSHLLLDRRAALTAVVPQPEGGQRVALERPASMVSLSEARPVASIAWQGQTLYMGHSRGGLFARSDQPQTTLTEDRTFGDMVAGPQGTLLVVAADSQQIVQVNPERNAWTTLVTPDAFSGTLRYLAPTASGGLFFTAHSDTVAGGLFFRGNDGQVLPVHLDTPIARPHGIALSDDGRTLFINDAKGPMLWAFQVGPDGSLSGARQFGELFRADRRYGEPRESSMPISVEGMVVDAEGRLFVATSLGVQVFSAAGRLLGLITFPELLSQFYYPPRPTHLTFGGAGGNTLYVTCGDRVYAVPTHTSG